MPTTTPEITFKTWLLLLLALVVTGLPRFNGNTRMVPFQSYDKKYFEAYVEYFRGETPSAIIKPATNWRFLVPLIAAQLPFSPGTSINLINQIALALATWLLLKLMQEFEIGVRNRIIAALLLIVSFPVFYYSTISYVDPSALFFVMAGIYFRIQKNLWLFLSAIALGLTCKETIAVVLPFSLALALKEKDKSWVLYSILFTLLYVAEYQIIKTLAPLDSNEIRYQSWHIGSGAIAHNLSRPHTWLSFLLTFGITGIWWLSNLLQHGKVIFKNARLLAYQAGIAATLLLYSYSFITTVADGRILWHSVFFQLLTIFDPQINGRKSP